LIEVGGSLLALSSPITRVFPIAFDTPNCNLVLSTSLPQALGFLALALPPSMKFSFLFPWFPMESWYRSDVTHTRMEGLVKRGLLRERTEATE
jgi:hypothetical protein